MRWSGRIRLVLMLSFAGLFWFLLLCRGAHLSLHQHLRMRAAAHKQQTDVIEVQGARGVILDRTGRTIACTLENPSVALQLDANTDRQGLIRDLMRAGACTPQRAGEITGLATAGFHWVNRRWIPSAVLGRVDGCAREVRLVPEMKRFYPAGAVAPELLGIVGVDGHGLSGLEWRYDEFLSGRPGRILAFFTGAGLVENAPPPQVLEQPDPGSGLLLTIDSRMQEIARHRLREGIRSTGAAAGFIILMDPWTGGILALCEEPSFDPLAAEPVATERLKVSCFVDQYEPGSIFKIVPFAAGLEAGVISPDDSLDCGNGERIVCGCRIRDHRAFGTMIVTEVLSRSSNIGAGKIAELVGWEGCYRMAQALGFGLATGIDLAGEAPGFLPHPLHGNWSQRSLATTAYGQEVACTGLQMALAFSAIANGGVLMRPFLVSAQLDGEGRIVRRFEPQVVRRAMSPETAQTMTEMLRTVVKDGTGRAAEISWYPPAGKTGTAQVFDAAVGRYSEKEHVLSFIGFAPHTNPRILCEVVLRCQGNLHASEAVAPIFREVVSDLVWLLEEQQWAAVAAADVGEARVTVPDVRGLAAQAARRAILRVGLIPVLDGMGSCVEAVRPQPYRAVMRGQVVHLALGGEIRHGTVKVPEIRGLSLRRAVSLLTEAGLVVGVRGAGWVVRQSPGTGAHVNPGALCVVWASPEASKARCQAVRRKQLACQAQ